MRNRFFIMVFCLAAVWFAVRMWMSAGFLAEETSWRRSAAEPPDTVQFVPVSYGTMPPPVVSTTLPFEGDIPSFTEAAEKDNVEVNSRETEGGILQGVAQAAPLPQVVPPAPVFTEEPVVVPDKISLEKEQTESLPAPEDLHATGAFPAPMVLTPGRAWTALNRVSENMTVVTGEDFERLPAVDLADVLTYVPGVDVSSRTRFGHFTPVSIQGSSSRHVLVMVDGIPFNTQASGQADILSALPMMPVRQVEAVKGSAAASWGHSLGGVINVLTKEPPPPGQYHIKHKSTFSEHSTISESLELSGASEKFGYTLSGEFFDTDGARTRGDALNKEDVTHEKLFGKLAVRLTDRVKATGSFGYSSSDVNEGVLPSDIRFTIPYSARYGQLRFDYEPSERHHMETAFKFNRQSIRTDTVFDSFGLTLSSVSNKDVYYGAHLKSISTHRTEDRLVLGYDVNAQFLKSDQMNKPRDILMQAPYANYTFSEGPLDLTAGVRYDVNEEFGDQLNPHLGLVYDVPFLKNTLIRAGATRVFQSPPLLWKFFEDIFPGLTANNPDIKPERAWVYETGIETQALRDVWLKASLYRSDVNDAIETTLNGDGLFVKQNFEKFRRQGVELESKIVLTEDLILFSAGSFNDVEDRTTGETVRGRGVPRQSFRLGLDYSDENGWGAYLGARYDRWDSPAAAQPNDRKFIFDARLAKRVEGFFGGVGATAFLNVYNLTNSKYWSSLNFPLPERYVEGGFTIER